jgi:hypothetical protein
MENIVSDTPNDKIYLLSMSGDVHGEFFIRAGSNYLDMLDKKITKNITEAKVFYSRQDAWVHKQDEPTSGWQITPYSAKKLFEKKLKSK